MRLGVRCGELGRSPLELARDWRAGGRTPDFETRENRLVEFVGSGQEAIALAMRHWSVGAGNEVLIPAYNCGAEASAIIATGARAVMYRTDERAGIDIDDLSRRLNENTKAVCVIHYFGSKSDLRGLPELCALRNIKLLEDCALSLFTAGVGLEGDAAIFSLRKSLPATDGGVLTISRNGATGKIAPSPAQPAKMARQALSLSRKWARRRLGLTRCRAKATEATDETSLPDIPRSYYRSSDAPVAAASRFALGLLNRTNRRAVAERRRANHAHLKALLTGARGLNFFQRNEPIDTDVCPLGLPILVSDKSGWCARLNAAGVEVSPWWAGFHKALDWSDFPEARLLKQRLILLPVHQELSARDIEYAAAVVRRIADGGL